MWLCIPLLYWHPRPHALPKQPHNGTPATHHASQGEPGLQGLGRYLSIAVSTRGRKMVSSPPSIDSPPRGLAKRWNNHIGLNSIEDSHHKGGSSTSLGVYPSGQRSSMSNPRVDHVPVGGHQVESRSPNSISPIAFMYPLMPETDSSHPVSQPRRLRARAPPANTIGRRTPPDARPPAVRRP